MSRPEKNQRATVIEMSGVTAVSLKDPGVAVVEGVDWKVSAGDFWVVAGLQGSGKSDFLMMTAGLTAPQRGSYRLFGEEMPIFEEERLPQRLRLGFVFDGGQLFNRLTVAENIALPLRYHRELTAEQISERVDELLKLTELTSWANSTPGSLGRAWQKRAGLARALALQPEVLLLDNPVSGVDFRHAQWWFNLLDELSAGHDLMPDKRPVTLVVGVDDLRPWRASGRQFAVLKERRLAVLDAQAQLTGAADFLVKELLADAATKG